MVDIASLTRRRLSRAERREQLLDVASELVVERGIGALTMERLAEWAGVSKALPYQHFGDSDAVLVAVHNREVELLAARIEQALRDRGDGDAVDVLVQSYFAAVADRGDILALVATAGSPVARLAARDPRDGHDFAVRMLHDHVGLAEDTAQSIAGFVTGALIGAVQTVADGLGERRTVERATVTAIRGAVAALRDDDD